MNSFQPPPGYGQNPYYQPGTAGQQNPYAPAPSIQYPQYAPILPQAFPLGQGPQQGPQQQQQGQGQQQQALVPPPPQMTPQGWQQGQGQQGQQQGQHNQHNQQGQLSAQEIRAFLQHVQAQDQALRESAEAIRALELRINGLQGNLTGPEMKIKLPVQQKAGVIEYPELVPFPFFYGLFELQEANGSGFGATTSPVTNPINLDLTYTYLTDIDLYLMRTARPEGATDVLNAWLPRSATRFPYLPLGGLYQGFDFLFQVKLQSTGILWQSGFLPSALLDNDGAKGWELPIEYKCISRDTIVVEAQAIAARPVDYEYRLYVGFWGYQMRSRRG